MRQIAMQHVRQHRLAAQQIGQALAVIGAQMAGERGTAQIAIDQQHALPAQAGGAGEGQGQHRFALRRAGRRDRHHARFFNAQPEPGADGADLLGENGEGAAGGEILDRGMTQLPPPQFGDQREAGQAGQRPHVLATMQGRVSQIQHIHQ